MLAAADGVPAGRLGVSCAVPWADQPAARRAARGEQELQHRHPAGSALPGTGHRRGSGENLPQAVFREVPLPGRLDQHRKIHQLAVGLLGPAQKGGAMSTQAPESNLESNPYVGPHPFRFEQRNLFFGRDREASELLSLVIANRVVLFFAQSGAGKTSLLNTRLIPELTGKKF